MTDYQVTLTQLKKTNNILLLHLEFEKNIEFNFSAGQFIMVGYSDEKGQFKRSYSIASDPEHKTYIELCISLKEGGRGSKVLARINEGDKLAITGPLGVFKLQENPDNDVILVAGGTGISPLRSMIKHLLNTYFKNKLTIFYSFSAEQDYLYRLELEQLNRNYQNFNIIPISTKPSANWTGETEYVQKIFQKYIKTPENKDIYSCGPVKMIDELFAFLQTIGYKKEQLHREIWTN